MARVQVGFRLGVLIGMLDHGRRGVVQFDDRPGYPQVVDADSIAVVQSFNTSR